MVGVEAMTYWRSKTLMRSVRSARRVWRRNGLTCSMRFMYGRRETGEEKSDARKEYYREHRQRRVDAWSTWKSPMLDM